jgi:hypothetical protein
MSYAAVPDRRMPYDNDGTVLVTPPAGQPYTVGANTYPTGGQLALLNGTDCLTPTAYAPLSFFGSFAFWLFFPEQREVTGIYVGQSGTVAGPAANVEGSNDTTNGLDGTWETASAPNPLPSVTAVEIDSWRSGILAVSFTGPKRVIRVHGGSTVGSHISVIHVYGSKAAGQTPDDILYLDGTTAYAEFTSVEDFGDVPLGTTTTRTFKVKNGSATKTANTINIQCNDADFAISSDGVTWVTTINIASLAAGASSGVLYVRNTTPSPPAALGPRFARIVATVASYT